MPAAAKKTNIHVGVGGWVFEDWRDNFYPKGWPQKRELEYAASKLTSIEINGTYYGSQKPESFARWYKETPADFVFALKGPRFATNRRVLAEAGQSIERFLASGIAELKEKLGPINWQFMATKKFDPSDFEAFLKLLPKKLGALTLRHAIEVRHESFACPDFVKLARKYGAAIVYGADAEFPEIADVTASFVYVRAMGTTEKQKLGYSPAALKAWAKRAQAWADGKQPAGLPLADPKAKPSSEKREIFLYVISGFKPRNPAAAMAIIAELNK